MKTPEGYEKADIDKYLKSIGAYIVKPRSGGFGASGAPDFVCCWQGRFFSIEVKREKKKPTAIQDTRMADIRSAGGVAFWGTAMKVIPEIEAWTVRVMQGD